MIISQLTSIYLEKEKWHTKYLSKTEADEYHERLLVNGNILTYIKNNELIGYLEFYRINYEQFGRICCNQALDHSEDLLTGNIALVNRMWIKEENRHSEVFDLLVAMFIARNKDAEHYTTLQHHKKHKSLQTFYRKDWVRNIN